MTEPPRLLAQLMRAQIGKLDPSELPHRVPLDEAAELFAADDRGDIARDVVHKEQIRLDRLRLQGDLTCEKVGQKPVVNLPIVWSISVAPLTLQEKMSRQRKDAQARSAEASANMEDVFAVTCDELWAVRALLPESLWLHRWATWRGTSTAKSTDEAAVIGAVRTPDPGVASYERVAAEAAQILVRAELSDVNLSAGALHDLLPKLVAPYGYKELQVKHFINKPGRNGLHLDRRPNGLYSLLAVLTRLLSKKATDASVSELQARGALLDTASNQQARLRAIQ